jgi:hypothetical protein
MGEAMADTTRHCDSECLALSGQHCVGSAIDCHNPHHLALCSRQWLAPAGMLTVSALDFISTSMAGLPV